LDIKKNIGGLA